jgi:PAS domain S-box-containing protein
MRQLSLIQPSMEELSASVCSAESVANAERSLNPIDGAAHLVTQILMEGWAECVFLLDASWCILYANQAVQARLGFSPSKPLGLSFDSLFTVPIRKRDVCRDRTMEQRAMLIIPNGGTCPVSLTLQSFPNDKVLVTLRDIKEQVEGERHNRSQMAYYKALFENTPCGVVTFDDRFTIIETNQTLRRMLGYAGRHLYQRALKDIFESPIQDEVTAWQVGAEQQGRFYREMEATLRKRDGRAIFAHGVVTLLPDRQKSGTFGIVILKDITGRREAELRAAQQHQLNDRLLRESAAMIGMLDRDGRIVMVNPAVERASGYKSSELIGKSIWDCGLVDPSEEPMARNRMRQIFEGAERVTGISRARTKSGELRIMKIHNTATRDDQGQVENIIITAVDVTEENRLQQLMMETVEHEQARIGHDLHDGVGQLLTGIGVMTESLAGDLSGSQKTAASRIFDLVQQAILHVRQLSRCMSPTALEDRDLATSLLLLAETLRSSLRISCQTKLDTTLKVEDRSASGHLFRIAQEAANNAIRHGRPQKVCITLRADDSSHGVLEIFNDGVPFECPPAQVTQGIGLRVMKHRAGLIHAEFSINRPPDGGLSVICRFPLASSAKIDHPKPNTEPTY